MTAPARPPLVLVPQYFGSLVFDRRSSRYLPFDREATAWLERALVEPVWGDRSAFRAAFERAGFFAPDGRLAAVALPAEPPPDHLLGPLAVHVEVIAACNLTCAHCFAGELPRKTSLTLRELDELFAQLAALGSFRVGLTGGEPLLRRDLLDVIDAATAHGLHPCLTTNGLLLDEHLARELGRRKLAWVNVSLDGATAATSDAVRGAGAFDEAVRRLRAFGRHLRFTLAFTITRDSAREVEACAALARELGAHTAVFRPLYPVGTAAHHPDLLPSFAEYQGALARLGADARPIDAFSPTARAETQAVTYRGPGCGAANLVASVSSTGEVNPCSFLGGGFDSGNIRDRPFAEIWRAGHAFRRLRAPRPDDAFRGGCRARAQAAHGDAFARDPWHDAWRGDGPGAAPCAAPPTANHRVRVHLPLAPAPGGAARRGPP